MHAHYDLSDDFFRLFLDRRMVYSCAYFSHPEESLEEAQERKLDLIRRKLQLRPGDAFLDVGCGWGALVLWAAERYGAVAHGITLSRNQADAARESIARAGLSGRVTIEERHYKDLPEAAFDKIASIGMIERHRPLRRILREAPERAATGWAPSAAVGARSRKASCRSTSRSQQNLRRVGHGLRR